jgi:transposase-like protein
MTGNFLACPACGTTAIQHKGRQKPSAPASWFRCKSCGHRWKLHTAEVRVELVTAFRLVRDELKKGY